MRVVGEKKGAKRKDMMYDGGRNMTAIWRGVRVVPVLCSAGGWLSLLESHGATTPEVHPIKPPSTPKMGRVVVTKPLLTKYVNNVLQDPIKAAQMTRIVCLEH